jgi:hypothetical protein
MLSAEERRSMLEEAADPRRREVMARFSRRRTPLGPAEYLRFLELSSELLAGRALAARRRPRQDPGTFLL